MAWHKQNQYHIEYVDIAMNAWLEFPLLDKASVLGFDNMQLLNEKKQWHICDKKRAQVILLERRHF